MKRILGPAAATLVTVVSVIALNGWNRSGEPLQRLTLTERELPLAWSGPDDKREMRLRLEHQGRFDPLDARNWLTEDRLRALGFVFDVMPGAPEAGDTYRRMLPKIAWVALEYNGPAWQDIERRRLLRALADKEPAAYAQSRLVAVDASLDRDALLARYPAEHLVLRASIRLSFRDASQNGPLVFGYVSHLIPDHVTVPLHLKDRVANLADRHEAGDPRYEVDLALGRLGIPYITDIRPLR